MNRRKKILGIVAATSLALAIPAAVIARSEREPARQEASGPSKTDDEQLEEFEPTERIDADESISFPVDI